MTAPGVESAAAVKERSRLTERVALRRPGSPVLGVLRMPVVHAPIVCVAVAFIVVGLGTTSYYGFLTIVTLIYATAALGLDIPAGLLGQMSLAQSAAYAVGAFLAATMTLDHGWPIIPSCLLALVAGTVMGALLGIPSSRFGLIGVGVVTLGATLIVQDGAAGLTSITGGLDGRVAISAGLLSRTPALQGDGLAILVVVVGGLAYIAHWYIRTSNFGRQCVSMRDDRIGLRAMGGRPWYYFMATFATGTGIGAVAGSLYAYVAGVVSPDVFSVNQSVLFLLMVILGGPGTRVGPVLGVAIVGTLPILLSNHPTVGSYLYGGILVLVVLVLPRGLMPRTGLKVPRPASLPVPTAQAVSTPQGAPAGMDITAGAGPRHGPPLAAATPVLEACEVSRRFGGVAALTDVSITVRPGEVLGVVGPNGSGKTTLLNVLSGFYRVNSGLVRLEGRDVTRTSVESLASAGLGRTFQTPRVFGSLTVGENVMVARSRRTRSKAEPVPPAVDVVDQFLARTRLIELWDHEVRGLSHGQRALLGLVMAVAREPRVVALDEPAGGLSSAEMDHIGWLVRRCTASGTAFLIIEHHFEWLRSISTEMVVLDAGRLIWSGSPDDIVASPEVRMAYLGDPA